MRLCAGREDMDVRMLGGGRPFVLEILNQRAAMPALDTFAILEEQLRQVRPSPMWFEGQ